MSKKQQANEDQLDLFAELRDAHEAERRKIDEQAQVEYLRDYLEEWVETHPNGFCARIREMNSEGRG